MRGVKRRRIVDSDDNYYNTIVPQTRAIQELSPDPVVANDDENDAFEEVSIDGSCPVSTGDNSTATKTDAETKVECNRSSTIFKCKPCKMYFPLYNMLNKHLQMMHGCPSVAKITRPITEPKRLEPKGGTKNRLPRNRRRYQCQYCPFIASRKSIVKLHIICTHPDPRQNEPPVSSKTTIKIPRVIFKGKIPSFDPKEKMSFGFKNDINEFEPKEVDEEFEPKEEVEELELKEEELIIEDSEVKDDVDKEEVAKMEEQMEQSLNVFEQHDEEVVMEHLDQEVEIAEVIEENSVEHMLEEEVLVTGIEEFVEHDGTQIILEESAPVELIEEQEVLEDKNIENIIPGDEELIETGLLQFDETNVVEEEVITIDCDVIDNYGQNEDQQPQSYRNMYLCPYCDYLTDKRTNALLHIDRMHDGDWVGQPAPKSPIQRMLPRNRVYTCPHCPEVARTRSLLYEHTREAHRATVKPAKLRKQQPKEIQCELCDFRTEIKRKMQMHWNRKHVTELRHHCEYCGKKFKVRCDLTSHIRFQHFRTPIVCDICGKVCYNSNALSVHQRREHFQPEFQCHVCKRRMVSQENLDEHILRQHEKRVPYMCEQCGKVFDQASKLRQHLMTHTGERPHNCHVCGKSFARRAVFRQHLLIHTGEKPYVCDICGKSFTQKPGLICHRKMHPGEKPPLPVVYIDDILNKFTKQVET